MRPIQAHCHRGLGTPNAKTGQQEQARAALTTALELYRAMDMSFWLTQGEATPAPIGGKSPPGRECLDNGGALYRGGLDEIGTARGHQITSA